MGELIQDGDEITVTDAKLPFTLGVIINFSP